MPAKYTIHTKPAAPRLRPVGKLGIVDWREDCSSCHNCVKRACIYGLYRDEADTLRDEIGYLDYIYQCKGCLSCVQNCTKNILTRVVNPEYLRLGDDYYSPDIVLSTWFQAGDGPDSRVGVGLRRAVQRAGLRFDVDRHVRNRPAHARRHPRPRVHQHQRRHRPQAAATDVGRRPIGRRAAAAAGNAAAGDLRRDSRTMAPRGRAGVGRGGRRGDRHVGRRSSARDRLGSSPLRPGEGPATSFRFWKRPAPRGRTKLGAGPLVMVEDHADVMSLQAALKRNHPEQIVAIRVQATPAVAAAGGRVDRRRGGSDPPGFRSPRAGGSSARRSRVTLRDVLRDVHGTLVKQGIRDEVTLVASGGIALAEHVAKAIICGADLVAVDIPLLLALECRLCGECGRGQPCPDRAWTRSTPEYGAQRIVNLIGAWHQQLIEVLGAMGIREVRRLRGETGRCMFFEDLERDTFGRLFGVRKKQVGYASA